MNADSSSTSFTQDPNDPEKTGAVEQFIATIDDVTEKVRQSHIIYSQKMFIGSQAKLTADSAFGAARSLASARAMIAAQSAENAMLNETIQILRDEVVGSSQKWTKWGYGENS